MQALNVESAPERFYSLLTVTSVRYRSRFCIGAAPDLLHQATIVVDLKYRSHFATRIYATWKDELEKFCSFIRYHRLPYRRYQ